MALHTLKVYNYNFTAIYGALCTASWTFSCQKLRVEILKNVKANGIYFQPVDQFIKWLIISLSVSCSVWLVEELQQQLTQGSTQREEIIRLKQELQLLRRDLVLSGALNYECSNDILVSFSSSGFIFVFISYNFYGYSLWQTQKSNISI